jgi:hypothetical protein
MILAGVTVAIGAGAYFVSRTPAPTEPGSAASEKEAFLPELRTALAGVMSIEIKDPTATVNLRRVDAKSPWTLAEKSDFLVGERVQPLLSSLVFMKVIEPKTSKPELFQQIGVADLDKPGSTAKLVTLKDSSGKVVASLVLGNSGDAGSPSAGGEGSLFVRKAGENQSYLVSGSVTADTDAMSWIEKTVLQVERNSIKSVTVTRHDDPAFAAGDPAKTNVFEAFRDAEKDVNFKVRNMPAGRELSNESAADAPTTPLGFFSIEDVKPRDQVDFEKLDTGGPVKPAGGKAPFARTTARYAKFDGMVITARVTKQGGKAWIAFDASFDETERPAVEAPKAEDDKNKPVTPEAPKPEAAKAEPRKIEDVKKDVEAFNAKHGKWAYAVQDFTAGQIATRLEDLLAPPVPSKTTGPEAAGPQVTPPEENILVPEPPK